MRVFLSENAFINLLLSAAEVYKRECLGFLLGHRLEDKFIIDHVFNFQSARRGLTSVVSQVKSHKKIDPILAKLEKFQTIGDFHSHTQLGDMKGLPQPSYTDYESMIQDRIYLIIAINKSHKNIKWKENRDKTISGSAGEFFFKIATYYLGKDEHLLKSKLYCSFPHGF